MRSVRGPGLPGGAVPRQIAGDRRAAQAACRGGRRSTGGNRARGLHYLTLVPGPPGAATIRPGVLVCVSAGLQPPASATCGAGFGLNS